MKEKKISRDVIFSWAGALFLFLIFILICICFKYFIDEIEKNSVETVTLRSISYQNVEKGNFALGCSTIRGKNYYVCYQVCEDGGLKLLQVNAAMTVIYETLNADDTPYAVIERDAWEIIREVKLYVPENIIYESYDFGQ